MARTKTSPGAATPPSPVQAALRRGGPEDVARAVAQAGEAWLRAPTLSGLLEVDGIELGAVAWMAWKGFEAGLGRALELVPDAALDQALYFALKGAGGTGTSLFLRLLHEHATRGHTTEMVATLQRTGGVHRLVTLATGLDMTFLGPLCAYEGGRLGTVVLGGSRVTKEPFLSSALIEHAKTGEVVDYLCKRWNQDPNIGLSPDNCDRARPIHSAAYQGRADVLEALLNNGAHLDARQVNGMPVVGKAIHCACAGVSKDVLKCLRLLVSRGQDPTEPSLMAKQTPLAVALAKGNVTAIRFLVVEARVPVDADRAAYEAAAAKSGSGQAKVSPVSKHILASALDMMQKGASRVEDLDPAPASGGGAAAAAAAAAPDGKRLRVEGEVIPLPDILGAEDNAPVLRADTCRLSAETRQLTCASEFQAMSPDVAALTSKAVDLERWLQGTRLCSDGEYAWLGFWAAPSPGAGEEAGVGRRSTRQRAAAAGGGGSSSSDSSIKDILLGALGSEVTSLKVSMVSPGRRMDEGLCQALGWPDPVAAVAMAEGGDPVPGDTSKLDRGERLGLLKRTFGTSPVFSASFLGHVATPVVVGCVASGGALVGVISMRVST